MIRLDTNAQSRWIDVAPGVRFLVRPPLAADFTLARHAAARVGAEGGTGATMADAGSAFTAAVARRVTSDWEGVGDMAGAPLPFTADYVEMLVLRAHHVQIGFDVEYIVPALTPDEEKNVSSGSPNGTSAAAPATAKRAASAARSAPTKSKRRKPSKAPSPGKSSAAAAPRSAPRSAGR